MIRIRDRNNAVLSTYKQIRCWIFLIEDDHSLTSFVPLGMGPRFLMHLKQFLYVVPVKNTKTVSHTGSQG